MINETLAQNPILYTCCFFFNFTLYPEPNSLFLNGKLFGVQNIIEIK